MKVRGVIRESWASGVAAIVPFLLVSVLGLAMVLTTVLTAGRSAAGEAQVQAQLEKAGSREVLVTDTKNQGVITPQVVSTLRATSAVSRVIALSLPVDTTNAAIPGNGGTSVATWWAFGDLAKVVHMRQGRLPRSGEAIISNEALHNLGLQWPVGALATSAGLQIPIVGLYSDTADTDLGSGAIVQGNRGTSLSNLRVVATTYGDASAVQSLVLSVINPPDPTTLNVTSPTSLASLQKGILGGLSTSNQAVVLLVLGAGGLLIAVVTLSDTLVRRRELGRRRALGISRRALVALVVVRTIYPASIGLVAGTGLGVLLTALSNSVPPATFLVGVGILGIASATISSLVPALIAAFQDPVRILRTP